MSAVSSASAVSGSAVGVTIHLGVWAAKLTPPRNSPPRETFRLLARKGSRERPSHEGFLHLLVQHRDVVIGLNVLPEVLGEHTVQCHRRSLLCRPCTEAEQCRAGAERRAARLAPRPQEGSLCCRCLGASLAFRCLAREEVSRHCSVPLKLACKSFLVWIRRE